MSKFRIFFNLLVLSLSFALSVTSALAQDFNQDSWVSWKNELQAEVVKKGISESNARHIIAALEYDADVIDKDSNQVFKRLTFPEYEKKAVNQGRIDRGRTFYKEHKAEIDQFANQYGVSPSVIVALLGMETDYGGYTGTYDVLNSLATLAYGSVRDNASSQESRRKYFRSQIYYAIKMLDEDIVERKDFKGSWAGAFGINQHMPESFYVHVIDGDKDGDLEILNKGDLSDVFATTANHLKKVGWDNGFKWGREVRIPSSIKSEWIENKTKKELSEWRKLGVTLPDGSPIPVVDGMKAALVVPRGMPEGHAYFAYENFFAFKRWNNSDYFALAVGLLSDRIPGYE